MSDEWGFYAEVVTETGLLVYIAGRMRDATEYPAPRDWDLGRGFPSMLISEPRTALDMRGQDRECHELLAALVGIVAAWTFLSFGERVVMRGVLSGEPLAHRGAPFRLHALPWSELAYSAGIGGGGAEQGVPLT